MAYLEFLLVSHLFLSLSVSMNVNSSTEPTATANGEVTGTFGGFGNSNLFPILLSLHTWTINPLCMHCNHSLCTLTSTTTRTSIWLIHLRHLYLNWYPSASAANWTTQQKESINHSEALMNQYTHTQDANVSLVTELSEAKRTIVLGSQCIIELEHTLNTSTIACKAVEGKLNALKGTCDELRDHLSKAVAWCDELKARSSNAYGHSSFTSHQNRFSPYPGPGFHKHANFTPSWWNDCTFNEHPSATHSANKPSTSGPSTSPNTNLVPPITVAADNVAAGWHDNGKSMTDGVKTHHPSSPQPYNPNLDSNNPLFDWDEYIVAVLWYVKAKIDPKMKSKLIAQTLLLRAPAEDQIPGLQSLITKRLGIRLYKLGNDSN